MGGVGAAGAAVAVGCPVVGDGVAWLGVGDPSDAFAADVVGVAAGAVGWVVGCDVGAAVAEGAVEVAALVSPVVADATGVGEEDAFAVGVGVATEVPVVLAVARAGLLEGVAAVGVALDAQAAVAIARAAPTAMAAVRPTQHRVRDESRRALDMGTRGVAAVQKAREEMCNRGIIGSLHD